MIFSIDEMKRRIIPVAEKYSLRAVYIFGSYARNEATDDSDIDLLIDRSGSKIRGLFDMSALHNDLSEAVGKKVDLITTQALDQKGSSSNSLLFAEKIREEIILIYSKS